MPRMRERGGLLHRESGQARYRMRAKLVDIGDDFYIENDAGDRVFYVDGKALRVRDTFIFRDMNGNELIRLQEKMLRIKDSMNIYRGDDVVATVKKAIISPLRDKWTIKVTGGPDLEVKGNILDHEYTIKDGRTKVAEVSKKWFRVRDTYGVDIAPDQDDVLLLAATVAIDNMAGRR